MRRILLFLVAGALAGGCGWDGPTRDVRVVTASPQAEPADIAAADPGATSDADADAGVDPPGAPAAPGAPLLPGREDRPASLGSLSMPVTIAVVGDSLTVASSEEITDALTRIGARVVLVDSKESRRMASGSRDLPSGVSAIEDILTEHDPDLWVVALGTNDVAAGTVDDQFVDDLRSTIAAVPSTSPLVWVDVWIRDRLDEVVEANTLLRRELARRRAPTEVVDWFSRGTTDGIITGDGIHLTPAGQARFAAAIADAVVVATIAPD